jgi:peptidoglycan/xylan/chitin deacetylase (PgdA/CDA1 family)
MRSIVRRMAELALVASGAPRVAGWLRPGTLVLAYHNVVPDDALAEGDRSLHLPLARLREQLLQLRRTHDVVPLGALLLPGPSRRPRAAVTFDDAYAGALTLGVPLARELDVPVTIFVAPALLGRRATWWDLLADPANGLADAVRDHALGPLRGEHDRVLAWAETQGLPMHEPTARLRIGTLEELRAAAAEPGVTIGLHTWSHPNLAALDAAETSAEIRRCRHWLMEHVGPVEPWLAYPYGRFSDTTVDIAAREELAWGFRVEGGVHRGEVSSPLRHPRLNVPAGLSRHGFALRAAGLR